VLARWATRRRRWAEADDPVAAAEAAWREVVDAATDVDLRPHPTETPRDLARRLPREASLSAAGRNGLAELAGQLERARYAAPPEASEGALEAGRLRALAGAVRDDLLASLSTRDRRLARWWPASGRAQVAEVVGEVGSRVDRVLAGVGRR
jgi:hypothetical protein